MSEHAHILIVEDEPELAGLLRDYLLANNFGVTVCYDGLEADAWLQTHFPDLILLDLMLPGKSGLDICRDLRKTRQTPVIMLTAKVEEIDRLLGLELGADDYVCKPYSPREVVARVKAVLRRTQHQTTETDDGLTVMEGTHKVAFGGSAVALTTVEMALFKLLHSAPGRIFARQLILERIYDDYRVVSDRTVDSHIKKLRKKLETITGGENVIHSVYGAGYKFERAERADEH